MINLIFLSKRKKYLQNLKNLEPPAQHRPRRRQHFRNAGKARSNIIGNQNWRVTPMWIIEKDGLFDDLEEQKERLQGKLQKSPIQADEEPFGTNTTAGRGKKPGPTGKYDRNIFPKGGVT